MRILYQIPSLETIYAGRTIYNGYKNAFEDLGHDFRPLTADDDMSLVIDDFLPDVLITGLSNWSMRYLDLPALKKYRQKGLRVLVNIPFHNSPISKLRLNETPGVRDNPDFLRIISSNELGDFYYNICEPDDQRMEGFKKDTGQNYYTVPLAADKIALADVMPDIKFSADISYIGTNLPDKRAYFRDYVFPLGRNHDLKLYGQDWTNVDKALGWIQRFGQYFNIKPLAGIRKPKLRLGDEGTIYASSVICINIHETYQKEFGGDCNERTFKIPLCNGFEITDSVSCISRYFVENEEMVIAKDMEDWFAKIEYYLRNPDKRLPIVEAGHRKVLNEHTYHNRANQLLEIATQ